MALSRRDQLVDTALELFYREGFHATGIDRIVAQAGVAKMTLYKHFRSKDELILAALRRRDEGWRNWFMREVERRASTPRARLLALYDALGAWFAEKEFSGCMFINAAAEFGDREDPIRAAAAEHKRLVENYVRDLADKSGARTPDRLARKLMLLLEGAIVMAHVAGEPGAAQAAREAAAALLEAEPGLERARA